MTKEKAIKMYGSMYEYHKDRYYDSANLPSGLSSNGLPLGIQLIGNYFKEKQLLQLAALAEKELAFNE